MSVIYKVEGKTPGVQNHCLETPDSAQALEHALKCWFVYGDMAVTIERAWKPEPRKSEASVAEG